MQCTKTVLNELPNQVNISGQYIYYAVDINLSMYLSTVGIMNVEADIYT